MPVETWDARYFTADQADAIGAFVVKVWPKPNVTAAGRAEQQLALGRQYAGHVEPGPRAYVFVEAGRVIAHAAILPRTIRTARGEMTIAGLSRVGVDPQERGRGLGELITLAALASVDGGDFPFALFQTSERVRPFYEKLGAVRVENPIINSLGGDRGNPFWDERVMRYPGTGDWPGGTIDLRGPGY